MTMRTKKTYTIPETEFVMLNTHGRVMQDTLQNTFSGGDYTRTGIIIGKEADDSDGDNRSNQWTNHLWDDLE